MLLQVLANPTPFKAGQFVRMGKQHQFCDVIVLKGSFELAGDELHPCAKQTDLVWADEYWDAAQPELSSLKAAADIELGKPSSDVFITGTVRHYGGKPAKEWSGTLRVVNRQGKAMLDKTLRFTGPRYWRHSLLGGWTLSPPEPAAAVALRYELAYGGWWTDPKAADPVAARQVYLPNPSGSGYFGKSHDTRQDYPGPQIESGFFGIGAADRDYPPVGFGPIARFWPDRARYAGTYDDTWLRLFEDAASRDCIPDYPQDFDYRHFQAAPPDQITPTLLGGDETIQLLGFSEASRMQSINLPRLAIHADLFTGNGTIIEETLRLDTVHIDLDGDRVHLTWRLTLPHTLGIHYAELYSQPLEGKP